MTNCIQPPITIQENMDFLKFLYENYPDHEQIIKQTEYLITFFGVQPELETISFDDKDAIMLFWDVPGDDYMAIYVYGKDTVGIEYVVEGDGPEGFEMTIPEAIAYYKTEWHDRLFVQEVVANESNN